MVSPKYLKEIIPQLKFQNQQYQKQLTDQKELKETEAL